MAFTYVKKITASLGHLRRLAAVTDPTTGEVLRPASDPVPLMRIKGRMREGWGEDSEYGSFIRWIGEFQADVLQRDGSIETVISRNLILPAVASDFLALRTIVDSKATTIKGRNGDYYAPANDFSTIEFVMDLWLVAPKTGKVSSTGYEYEVRPVMEAKEVLSLDAIAPNAPAFGPVQTAQALPAPEEKTEAPALEAKPENALEKARAKAK